jgi:hypothetical protein
LNRNQDPDDLDGAHAWGLHSNPPALWDDDPDPSEPSDASNGYITFTGQSTSPPPEFELGFRQFGLSGRGAFVLDFPEDVGELVEHDTVLAGGGSGVHVIGRFGRSGPGAASEIPVELSTPISEDSQNSPGYGPNFLLPRIREILEDGGEPELFPHLPHPGSDVTDVPVNVSLSPLILTVDGFPDDTTQPYLDLVGGVDEILTDVDWIEGQFGEMIHRLRSEEDDVEWDHWCGQLVEELDRDLDSCVGVREGVRAGLERL